MIDFICQKKLKLLAKRILEKSPDTIILLRTRAAGKVVLLFIRSEEIFIDLSRLMETACTACTAFRGHGGGRPKEGQGGLPEGQYIEKALQKALNPIPLN